MLSRGKKRTLTGNGLNITIQKTQEHSQEYVPGDN